MKLYIYDHCPYCTKARMIFGYKNLDVELVTLLNDDEKTPNDLIGQKMVPIFQPSKDFAMGESLDIIEKVDSEYGDSKVLSDLPMSEKISKWLKASREYLYPLAMPRWVNASLEEFTTDGAIQYFTKKKEDYIGSFKEHLENTPSLIEKAHAHLNELDKMIANEIPSKLSLAHIHLYATLRCLTIVKEIEFPGNVLKFMKDQVELSKVPFH